jgi:hypothetical protein
MLLLAGRAPGLAGCSPQIPAAARMLGINPSTCVQVAFVKIPRAGRGRGARHRTPAAIGIGGINPSAPVQIAPVIILAAGLRVGRTHVGRRRDHSYRQGGQQPEEPKAHNGISLSAPVMVTARITLLVVSFHYQSVAIPALPWFKQRNFMLANLTHASPASASMTSKTEHARSAWSE